MNRLQKEYKQYYSGGRTLLQLIITIIFFLFCSSVNAAKFYFANSGSDAAAGTSAAPFQTIAKLNAVWALTTTQPGDTFFLRRGDSFYGSIIPGKSGIITKPIVLTYYGTGANPIITGFSTASGFINLGGNIWESSAISGGLSTSNFVLINGQRAEEGRWPNSNTSNGGYATIDSHNGQISITDAALATNFTGGELILRVKRYILSPNLITNVAGTTITYTASFAADPTDGYGYFIQNHPLTLDRQNEWYYNGTTKKIRVYSTTSPTNVQVVTQNNLVVSNSKSYIKIIGITFSGSNSTNINLNGGVGNYIQDCIVKNSGNEGIVITSQNSFILNTQVRSSNNIGILNNYNGNNLTVRNCTIDSTGYVKGAGYGYYGSYVGLHLRAKGAVIEDNTITRTGYDGIYFFNYDSLLIRHNLIDTFCVVGDDGGGIYTGENNTPVLTYRRIIGNTISNGIGAPEGTTDLTRQAEGIYPDVRSAGLIIQDNNISNVDIGLFIHYSNHITATGNTFYNTPYAIEVHNRAADPASNLNISNNIAFSKLATHRPFYIKSDANDAGTYGVINNNHYAKISTQTTMFRVDNPGTNTLSLAGFRTLTGYDLASTQISYLATDTVRYLFNPTASPLAIDLTSQGSPYNWKDIIGNNYTSLALAPYTSKVLIRGTIVTGTAPVASISFTPILCFGGLSTVTVSATGNGPFTGTGTFTRGVGTWQFIVSDVNNLKDTVTAVITQPSLLTLTESHSSITVNGGTSTVTFASTGGTGVKTYKIGAGSYQSSAIFTGVIAGNYTGYVKDANNCITTLNFSITQPSVLNATAVSGAILCNGGSTSVTVTASGGTAPYSGTGTFIRSAGSYQFIVIDAASVRDTAYVTLTQPALLTLSETHTAISIYGNNSTVTFSSTGGVGTKVYKIGSGAYQSSNVFSLPAGNYTAYVSDGNSCITSIDFTITQPAEFIGAVTANGTIFCTGDSTTLTVAASGGIAPYTGLGTFTVPAGSYSYPIQDAAGAKDTVYIDITEPALLTLSEGHTAILTYGATSTVTLTAGGGTGIDSFKLGTGSYQLSNVFAGVLGGTTTATVKDENGCTTTINFTISQPAPTNPPVGSATPGTILCNGGTTSVTISATGDTPITGIGVFTQGVGTTSYIVTDVDGEKDTVDVTLTEPALLTLSQSYPTILVNGGTTTLTLSASGGTGSKTYSIGGSYQSSPVFSGVTAGPYTVSVKDANNCITSNDIVISEPSVTPLTVTATWDSILCTNGTSSVLIEASGGLEPYNGVGSFDRTAGNWSFTVTDSAGVSTTKNITITQPAPLTLSVTALSSTSVNLTASGGTGVDSFSIGGVYQLSSTFTGLTINTSYTATVKDENGCIATINFSLGSVTQRIRSNKKLKFPSP